MSVIENTRKKLSQIEGTMVWERKRGKVNRMGKRDGYQESNNGTHGRCQKRMGEVGEENRSNTQVVVL
jgi:hypothetical protein